MTPDVARYLLRLVGRDTLYALEVLDEVEHKLTGAIVSYGKHGDDCHYGWIHADNVANWADKRHEAREEVRFLKQVQKELIEGVTNGS